MAWGGGSTGGTGGVQKPWLKKPSWVKSQQKWQPKLQQQAALRSSRSPRPARIPTAAPADFQFDREARYVGTVAAYWKWRGYGFIKPKSQGLVPGDWLYVHWTNIQTEDRYPSLVKGMEVEFGMMKWRAKRHNMTTLRAKFVTLPGGSTICVQDEQDSQKKAFVGGQHLRYTGTVKFYSPKGGYGYVLLDDVSAVPEPVPKELRVEEAEVNAGGRKLKKWLENLRVEFGIWKTAKGAYKVYNMTLPGGLPISEENLEHRQTVGGEKVYTGVVTYWNWHQNFGLIKPNGSTPLPPKVQLKLSQMQQAARQRGKHVSPEPLLFFRKADITKSCVPRDGLCVSFRLYVDDKGAGACEISG